MKNNVINENEMENVNGGNIRVGAAARREIQRKHSEDSADKQGD